MIFTSSDVLMQKKKKMFLRYASTFICLNKPSHKAVKKRSHISEGFQCLVVSNIHFFFAILVVMETDLFLVASKKAHFLS